MRSAVIALALSAASAAVQSMSSTPLLDYAVSHSFEVPSRDFAYSRRLSHVLHELERHPPPETSCAQTLGAKRFASLYHDLGTARAGLADYEGAVEAYEKALACAPRLGYLHAELASELLHLNRYVEARAVAEHGLAVDQTEDSLNRILAQLDFIEEHWSDAVERLKAAVRGLKDEDVATYWQCLLWLAQRRAGIERPELISRKRTADWPEAILSTLIGRITEDELLEEIEDEDDANRRREILSEALYYIGQQRLADGDGEQARRYLAATVNLKVHYFIEHHLALAELGKIRARSAALRQGRT